MTSVFEKRQLRRKREQTQQRFILTPKEAMILSGFNGNQEVSVYDLAGVTQMTPSEVREVLQHLQEKCWISSLKGQFTRLTAVGKLAKKHLKHHLGTAIISEDAKSWDAESLDRALDAEIARHQQP